MQQINHLPPPERMTPEHRRHVITSLLANGLARLRITGTEQSATRSEASEFELGFFSNQRVHTNPFNKTTTESKRARKHHHLLRRHRWRRRSPVCPRPRCRWQRSGLWQKLVGGETPTHNRQLLERRVASRLQALEFRKVDANLLDRNQRRIDSLVETGKVKKRDRHYLWAAGTALVRNTKTSSTA